MTVQYPAFKAAACHIASSFLDSQKTVEKAASWIGEAASNGATLVAFPEGFVPGFPVWAALRAPIYNHNFFKQLVSQALRPDGPEIARLRDAAQACGVYVSIGFSEGTDVSVGCIWNSNILIGPDGRILNLHRKLVPTYFEKLIWSNGDARGLRTTDTDIGRVGMLICGENTNPLSRYALMAQGEQVHVSTYPPFWPTRPPAETGAYDLRRAIEIRAGAHAFEAKVFNIVSSGFADKAMIDTIAGGDADIRGIMERSPKSVTMVLDPAGNVISEVLSEEEGIAYADIDTANAIEPKQFHDVVGYYNRFDIFNLTVDRAPREPATFKDQPGETVRDRAEENGAEDGIERMI